MSGLGMRSAAWAAGDDGGRVLTVIVALRNDAGGLRESLESIVANGPEAARRVCVEIVDSNSRDAPVEVFEAFSDRLAMHFRTAHDRGIYHAWNRAVAATETPWLTFLGAGDTFVPDGLPALLDRFGAPPEFDIVTGLVELLYPSGRREVRGLPYKAEEFARWFSVAHSGACYRRELFDRFGNFDESYRVTGDYEFLTRVGPRARFAFIEKVLSMFPVDGVSSASLRPLQESYRVRERYRTVTSFENRRLFARAALSYYAAKWLK